MRILRRCTLIILVTTATTAWTSDERPSAVICLINNHVDVIAPESEQVHTAALLERLAPGTRVRVGENSRAIVVFAGGQRFELGSGGQALVSQGGLIEIKGPVQHLDDVPTIAELVRLDPRVITGTDTAAARVRLESAILADAMGLDPPLGGAVRADQAVLSYNPIAGAQRYEVVVDGPEGDQPLRVLTRSTSIAVPRGVLDPDLEYHWSVRALGPRESRQRAGTVFRTISTELTAEREKLATEASETQTADVFVLLASVDAAIGLQREACDDLRHAEKLSAGDATIAVALGALSCNSDNTEER